MVFGNYKNDIMVLMKVQKKKKVTTEDLAGMVQWGFSEAAKRTDVLDIKVDSLSGRVDSLHTELAEFKKETQENFDHVHARLGTIERDVKDVVHKDEFEDLMARVKYLEKKMGIESGK